MLSSKAQTYIETIVLTVGALILGFWLRPEDPLFLHATFPWLLLIPVLIALRHGRLFGAIAITLIVLTMLFTIRIAQFTWNSYQLWLLGGITLTMICGEFHAMWERRQFSLTQKTNYLDTRLESLSRAYGVLRLSHDRLEESLIVKPATLRQSFLELRHLLMKTTHKFDKEVATAYLNLLASDAGFNEAGLYKRDKTHWQTKAIAHVGSDEPLLVEDVLIKRCLKKHHTAYVAVNRLDANVTSAYLAVVPMETSDEHLLAILVIRDIPFIALNEETLKKLSLLLAYIADEEWAAEKAVQVQALYPDCPSMFASELFKMKHLTQIAAIDSSVVAFYLKPSEQRKDIIFFLCQEKRALDIIWETTHGEDTIIFLLMPLAERSMITGYIQRIQLALLAQEGVTLGEKIIFVQHRQLSTYPDVFLLLADLFTNDYNI